MKNKCWPILNYGLPDECHLGRRADVCAHTARENANAGLFRKADRLLVVIARPVEETLIDAHSRRGVRRLTQQAGRQTHKHDKHKACRQMKSDCC